MRPGGPTVTGRRRVEATKTGTDRAWYGRYSSPVIRTSCPRPNSIKWSSPFRRKPEGVRMVPERARFLWLHRYGASSVFSSNSVVSSTTYKFSSADGYMFVAFRLLLHNLLRGIHLWVLWLLLQYRQTGRRFSAIRCWRQISEMRRAFLSNRKLKLMVNHIIVEHNLQV